MLVRGSGASATWGFSPGYRWNSLVHYPTPTAPTPLRTLYVNASTGDDSRTATEAQNPGTPWKTINKINANAQEGDRFILTGTFNAANGSTQGLRVGSVDGVQIFGSAPGAATLANGTAGGITSIWMFGMNEWWFEDLVVQRGAYAGGLEGIIWVAGANNNTFVRCDFDSCNVHVLGAGSTDNRFYDCTASGAVGAEVDNNGDWFFIQNGAHRTWVVRFDTTGATAWHSCATISYQGQEEATCDDCLFAGCNITNTGGAGGFLINGKAVRAKVEDCDIHNISDTYTGTENLGSRLGIEINGTDCVVRGNRIWECRTDGISLQSRSFNSFLEPCTGNHIYNNTVALCGSLGLHLLNASTNGALANNIIENNIFWDNQQVIGSVLSGGFDDGNHYQVVVYCNEIGGPGVWTTTDADGNIVRNNWFGRASGTVKMFIAVRNAADGGNLSYSLAQAEANYADWSANSVGNVSPALTNAAAGDMAIGTTSPCADAAYPVSGLSFLGAGPDIGAYETTGVSTNQPSGFLQVTARDFAAKVENGWTDRGDAEFTIEAVAGPRGDNSVGQALFPSGFVPGSGPIFTAYNTTGDKSKLFLRILGFRVDAGWYGHDATGINKIFFIAHGGSPGIYLQAKGGGSDALFFRLNTQMPSAIQTRDYELGQASTGGVDFECVRGTFYDIEVLAEENLVGSEDTGRLRMWCKASGASPWTLVADSDVEVPTYDAGAFAGLVFWDVGQSRFFNGEQRWNPTYGGGGGSNVPDDQYQQIDYIRISVPQ